MLLAAFYRSAAAVFGAPAGAGRWFLDRCYRIPLFTSRCAAIGKGLVLHQLPDITGHPRISVGEDVRFEGHLAIGSGRILDHPQLRIGNRVVLGHNVIIGVNREVVLEDDVKVGPRCRLMDSDAHPMDAEARRRKLPPPPEEIKAIRICRGAVVGPGTFVMKGVTIGESAMVAAGSVVIADIPAFAVAAGNPARVVATRPAAA